MKIVITMAGRGQRFRDAGYNCPKYMIHALGKTLFHWSMLSLDDFFTDDFIFIARNEDEPVSFITEECKLIGINNFNIVLIDHTTDGQATTVLKAKEFIGDYDELMIYNIDTFVKQHNILRNQIKGDGYIPGFYAEGDKWSFIKLDDKNKVIEIAEKKPISTVATLGLYYFKSFADYYKYYIKTFQDGRNLVNGEKYIAEIYNIMLNDHKDVYGTVLPNSAVWGLGTPNDLNYFMDNYE
ncbi:sugar phosphate nucleotidyltransferase [Flectobacillus rivi]|uniref:Sugar phosphate nucleotidyltransferase n=1 Tax=Flectobacillus rivi TaxID=2984209 RepID=A0ABT6YWV2_9BACT|nr:sugar phosphate nucleotidyltransferase [Flectobacillus rivi]MDI9873366.1 sugar phosphate nucleotidyltransferase [Flectobacillus rivi]